MARRRRRLLVPEAREALEQLKLQVISEKGPMHEVGPESTTRDAGKAGGSIGGPMVKRLIAAAEQQLNDATNHPSRPRI